MAASLPPDVIRSILSPKLWTTQQLAEFRLVCRSWQAALAGALIHVVIPKPLDQLLPVVEAFPSLVSLTFAPVRDRKGSRPRLSMADAQAMLKLRNLRELSIAGSCSLSGKQKVILLFPPSFSSQNHYMLSLNNA